MIGKLRLLSRFALMQYDLPVNHLLPYIISDKKKISDEDSMNYAVAKAMSDSIHVLYKNFASDIPI